MSMSPEMTHKPIFDTDLSKPPAVLIAEMRSKLSELRGQLHDLERAYPAWKERFEPAAGGLTCIISTLYNTQEEFEKHQAKWGWSFQKKAE
jgi:hypothetical protein